MRLVLVNPHTFAFGKTVYAFMFRKRASLKYDFFCDYYIKDKERDVAFYVDGTRSSFNINWPFFAKLFSYIELLFWMVLNKINPFKIKVYFNINKLNPKKDILFTFSRCIINVDKKNESKLNLNQYKGVVFIHFTHYFQKINKLSRYLKTIPNFIAVCESDLSKNSFFNKYLPYIKRVYQLPHAFGKRFVVCDANYDKRINKCVAMGTMCPVNDYNLSEFFGGLVTLQPMRKTIFLNSSKIRPEIDSLIKDFEEIRNIKKIKPDDSLATKIIKKVLPYIFLERIMPVPQKKYFQFNIVEKYNNYKMFICPEEIIGLPSVNTFEGMACQSAYFGIDSPMYRDIGLEPGRHYVAYEQNNLEDLILKIRYYQNHPDEIKKIARQGCDFVRQNFNRKSVTDKFWQDLADVLDEFSRNGKITVKCSFEK